MEGEGSSSKDDPPVPPQPPQFSICTALPGSPEWFSYWANEARETFDYNRRIAEYGKDMELWSRKIAGLSVEDAPDEANNLPEEPPKEPPATTETQTAVCQQEQCTSSESLQNNGKVTPVPPTTAGTQTNRTPQEVLSSSTFPTVVTLDGSDVRRNVRMLNTNPYMDIFNELMDFPCEENTQDPLDSPKIKRYFSHDVEIIREDLFNTDITGTDANSNVEGEKSVVNQVISNSKNQTNPQSAAATSASVKINSEIAEELHPIKEAASLSHLRENVETHISDVVKNIFKGLTGFVTKIKNGISGIVHEMKADVQNRDKLESEKAPVDFQHAYVNSQWKDADEFSQVDGAQTPSVNSHISNDHLIPEHIRVSLSGAKDKHLSPEPNEIPAIESKKNPVFRASMELGAFEINTWTESSGSTVRSGTTCRILCFSFKRVTTNEGTRLVFDKSVIDDNSLQVVSQPSDNRFCLKVTASRNGKMEELTIFLPANTDFEEIKIVDISKRYLSVSIPFTSPYSETEKRDRHSKLLDEVH